MISHPGWQDGTISAALQQWIFSLHILDVWPVRIWPEQLLPTTGADFSHRLSVHLQLLLHCLCLHKTLDQIHMNINCVVRMPAVVIILLQFSLRRILLQWVKILNWAKIWRKWKMICLKYILKDLKENVATSLFERSAVTLTNKGVFNKAESKTARPRITMWSPTPASSDVLWCCQTKGMQTVLKVRWYSI